MRHQEKHRNKYAGGLSVLAMLAMGACATHERAVLPADANPQVEIERVETDLVALGKRHGALLSPDSYERAIEYTKDAREAMEDGDREEALDDVAVARGALVKVSANVENFTPQVLPVLEARAFALDAGANVVTRDSLDEADKDLRRIGHRIEGGKFVMDHERDTELATNYRRIEIEARKTTVLGESREIYKKAVAEGAEKHTAKLAAETKQALILAEQAIERSVRSPVGYQTEVKIAEGLSRKLRDVLALARQDKVSEEVALTLWSQKNEITRVQDKLDTQTRLVSDQQQEVGDLKQENAKLFAKEEIDRKINAAREGFAANEAEVAKVGNNVVVRLKDIGFTSGSAELKVKSLDTLDKVAELVAQMPVAKVVVVGHTDSSGTLKKNMEVSEERALAVRNYFAKQAQFKGVEIDSRGVGPQRPIAPNNTAEGRAANRRVDVVIETSAGASGRTVSL